MSASSCSPLCSGLNLKWYHRHASLLGHCPRHSIRLFRKDRVLVLMKSLLENLRVQESMWIQRAPEHWSRLPLHWQSMPCLAMCVNRAKWASSEHFLYHLPHDPCLLSPPFSASVLTRLLPWFIITQSKVLSEEAKFAVQTLNSKQHHRKQLSFFIIIIPVFFYFKWCSWAKAKHQRRPYSLWWNQSLRARRHSNEGLSLWTGIVCPEILFSAPC